MNAWHFGFAVQEGNRHSLQFFDKDGEAVHKIYLTEQSDAAAYEALVAKYQAETQGSFPQTSPTDTATGEAPDSDIDVAGFQQARLDLKDTHAFFGLLQKFGVGRHQAMRLAPEGHATHISVPSTETYPGGRIRTRSGHHDLYR